MNIKYNLPSAKYSFGLAIIDFQQESYNGSQEPDYHKHNSPGFKAVYALMNEYCPGSCLS